MEQSIEALRKRYSSTRGGRASPEMVSGIKVECYGSHMPLSHVANISAPESRLIVVEPWDKTILDAVRKAILASDLGINPTDDGNIIRLAIPPLTQDRREELAKLIRQWAEEAKVSIRGARRDARSEVDRLEHAKELSEDDKIRADKELQELTDKCVALIDELRDDKVEEIMKI
jgi:ribosome recycling factor